MDDRRNRPARRAARGLVRRVLFVGLPTALAAVAAHGASALTAGAAPGIPYVTTNSPLVFDFVPVGSTSAPLSARITNSGRGSVTVTTIQLGGDYPTDFSIVANGCTGTRLSAGQSCSLSVVFHPIRPGTRVADLIVSDTRSPCVNYITLAGSGFTATVPNASTADCIAPHRTTTTTSSATTSTTTSTSQTTSAGTSGSGGSSQSGSQNTGLVTSAVCTTRRTITVHLQTTTGDSNVAASVYINGHLAASVHQRGLTEVSVSVRNTPPGKYAIEVVVTRASGKQVRSANPYVVTCGAG